MHVSQGLLPDEEVCSARSASESAIRLAVALLLLLAGLTAGTTRHWEAGTYLLIAALLGVAWGAPVRAMLRYLRRAAVFLLVFLAALLVFNWSPPFRAVEIGALRFSVSTHALSFGLAAMERAVLAILVGAGLFLSSGASGLLAGLAKCRVPSSAITVLFLVFRYAGVLAGEAQRMQIARRSRHLGSRLFGLRTLMRISEGFLLRTYCRSERVYFAMCARGFDGRIPVLAEAPGRPRGWIVGGVAVGFIVFVKIWFVSVAG